MGFDAQRTIRKEGALSGIGIHTGLACRVAFKPSSVNSGVQFFKDGRKIDTALNDAKDSVRCTSVGSGESKIQTVEHLLAAASGLGISNLRIEVEGPEIPGLDGSAAPFVKFFKELGIESQSQKKEVFKITEPILCYEPKKAIAVFPAEEFRIAYCLDYEHSYLMDQKVDFLMDPEVFEKEIAPARTFCTQNEALALKEQGFGLGANYENTLIVSENGPVKNHFRFPDECARHKVLDILGDLSLLGFSIVGRVVGLRSGHSLNRRLTEQIFVQRNHGNL